MRLLDLFCGAGGAAVGYHQAGFTDIVGVDIVPQPNYPFEFIQADALNPPLDLDGFDLIHASPPCQAYTTMNNRYGSDSPAYVGMLRDILENASTPYVIENVAGARKELHNPVELTGAMFKLRVHRPRLFELGRWFTMVPPRPQRQENPVAVYGRHDQRRIWTRVDGTELRAADLPTAQGAMGIDWMDWDEIREAIPPAYTKFIGEQFLAQQ